MKSDARIRYTKMRIEEAFFSLLATKPFNRVTVKDICDKAEINRATFYNHYMDTYDLMQKKEEEFLETLHAYVLQAKKSSDIYGLIEAALTYIKQSDKNNYALSILEADVSFVQKIMDLVYQEYADTIITAFQQFPRSQQKMVYEYLVNGSGAVIRLWIQTEMKQTVSEITELIITLVNNSITVKYNQPNSGLSKHMKP